jgi:uncharacterized protein (TIGR02147 family)
MVDGSTLKDGDTVCMVSARFLRGNTNTEMRTNVASTQVTTGPVVRSLAIRNFHRRMLEMAQKALDTVPPPQRDVTSVTVPLTPEAYESVRGAIARLRREVLALSAAHEADPAAEIYPISTRERSTC